MLYPHRLLTHPRARRSRVTASVGPVCQPIERRLLLCGLSHDQLIPSPEFAWDVEQREASRLASEGGPDAVSIVWSNRGLATDNFTQTFGASAGAARAVVDAALDHWERVITSWNRIDGTTTLQVNISVTNSNGYGAAGAPAASAPADGKPRTGSITLSRGRPDLFPNPDDSNGWYFDPNPNDHAEFSASITNAFAGRGVGLGSDFYSVVIAEITHVLGLISDKFGIGGAYQGYLLRNSGYVTFTNIVDNAEGGGNFGHFWVFDGPTVDHLMTSYNSGDATGTSWGNVVHSAGVRSSLLSFNGKQWQGSEDAGNALYSGNERTIPSWTMAHIFRDAYGYSIIDPEEFDTFYALLNRTSGVLTITGGDAHNTGTATSNDNISINVDGSDILVSVNVSNDIPGTRHLSGGGDLPAWTTRFPASAVNSIVINAGNGNDSIGIFALPALTPVTVNAGAGNDFIDIGGGDFDTRILSNITVVPSTGSDEIVVNDITDGPGADTANITSSSFAKQGGGTLSWNASQLETFSYLGSGNNDTINLASASAGTTYSISGLGGNDTLNVSGGGNFLSAIGGPVSFSGGTGTDVVNINDGNDSGTDTYQISGNTFTKPSGPSGGSVTSTSSTESMIISGGVGTNTWSVPQLSSFLDLTITGGNGIDNFVGFFNNNLDANLQSTLTFNAGAGTDSVTVNDQGSSGLVYNLDNNSLDKGGSGVLNYSNCESFTLNCNAGNNEINVLSTFSSCPVTINGNSGDDTLNVNDPTSFLFNFGSDISFSGGGGNDFVNITDESFGGTGTYTVVNGRVFLPFNNADVFYNTVEQVLIIGSQGNNTFNVNQTNVLTIVAGEDGNDTINVGNGDFDANITADVLVAGGDGADIAIVQDASDAGSNVWTVTNLNVSKNTTAAKLLTNFFGPTIDTVRINAGAGNSTFNVNSIGSSGTAQDLIIDAGAGNDTVNLAGPSGNLSANLFGNITVAVQDGTDSLNVNDLNDTGTDAYTLGGTSLTKSDWAFAVSFPFGSLDAMTLDASNAANEITVLGTLGENVTVKGNGGNDLIDVLGNFLGTFVTVDGGAGLDSIAVNGDASGIAGIQFANSQDLSTLRLFAGGTARLNANGNNLITATGLLIQPNGVLDLTDNAMILNYSGATQVNTIQAHLTNGYNGGAWNGTSGIRSSTAATTGNTGIGFAEATDIFTVFPATFEGQSVDNTAVLMKHTFYGDGNLDGTVNLSDFNRVAANFGGTPRRWSQGDFTFDQLVNLADFNRLAGNFGASGLVPDATAGDDDTDDDRERLPALDDHSESPAQAV